MEQTINERVKLLRNELAFSQNRMSNELGMSFATYRRLEVENLISPKHIKVIVEKLNVNKEWLLNGTGEMFNVGGFENRTNSESVNPWENALIKELKEEVTFLREVLKNMTLTRSKLANENFKFGIGSAGLYTKKFTNSVRVSA